MLFHYHQEISISISRENKFDHKKLNSVSIAQNDRWSSTIWIQYVRWKTDTKPLCSDPIIQKDWKKKYKDTLVGITTTLFGSYSMYNRIPIWKKLGKTKGSINIKPDDHHFFYWNEWIKEELQRGLRSKSDKPIKS